MTNQNPSGKNGIKTQASKTAGLVNRGSEANHYTCKTQITGKVSGVDMSIKRPTSSLPAIYPSLSNYRTQNNTNIRTRPATSILPTKVVPSSNQNHKAKVNTDNERTTTRLVTSVRPRKIVSSSNQNPKANGNTENERTKPKTKYETLPKLIPAKNKTLNGLYNSLLQINHTDLACSPYFSCVSSVLKNKNSLVDRQEKVTETHKLNKCVKLPKVKGSLDKRQSFSTFSINSSRGTQTAVTHPSKLENIYGTKEDTTSRKSVNFANSRTKLPPVAKSKGDDVAQTQGSNVTVDKTKTASADKSKTVKPSKTSSTSGGDASFRPPQSMTTRYWDNEIKNYYNWTSFCLMRRYRTDTKTLKEQLKCLGREGCSINDVIWKEAETFRKNIEKERAKLNKLLKPTTKNKSRSTSRKCIKKKILTNSTLTSSKRPPTRKSCMELVPPPSATESLFRFRKQIRPFSTTMAQGKQQNISTQANKQSCKSLSNDSIFPGCSSGQFISKGLQYRAPSSDTSFDISELSTDEQKSKFKSRFTLKNERLSFNHLKKAIR